MLTKIRITKSIRNQQSFICILFNSVRQLLKMRNTRTDLWGANVRPTKLLVIDLPGAEIRHHQLCNVHFMKGYHIPVKWESAVHPCIVSIRLDRP